MSNQWSSIEVLTEDSKFDYSNFIRSFVKSPTKTFALAFVLIFLSIIFGIGYICFLEGKLNGLQSAQGSSSLELSLQKTCRATFEETKKLILSGERNATAAEITLALTHEYGKFGFFIINKLINLKKLNFQKELIRKDNVMKNSSCLREHLKEIGKKQRNFAKVSAWNLQLLRRKMKLKK